jgi:hypothetical protein
LIHTGKVLSMITWNIGYAGLGKEMDFFYEGGRQVRPSFELSEKYLEGIISYIGLNRSTDFFLFQEVDLRSKRSYNKDQFFSSEMLCLIFHPPGQSTICRTMFLCR